MRDQSSIFPDHASVRFPTRRCTGLPTDTVPAWYTKTLPITFSSACQASGASAAIPAGFPGVKQFHDRALALFNASSPDPSNKAALDSLATQTIGDYYCWNSISFDEAFAQVIAPTPDGVTDLILWTYSPSDFSTRRMSAPYNADPEELYHHDPANADCKINDSVTSVTNTPCFETYTPIASLAGGMTTFQVMNNCIVDGILISTPVRTETAPCGCGCNGSGVVCANVLDNCSLPLPWHNPHFIQGALIKLYDNSVIPASSIGSCLTNSSGTCCITYPFPMNLLVVASGDCGTASSNLGHVSCGFFDINFTLPGTLITLQYLSSCVSPVTSGNVAFSGNGVNDPLLGPSGSGTVIECVPKLGTYTAAFTGSPCYQDRTDNIDVTECSSTFPGQTFNITLDPQLYNFTTTVQGCNSLPLAGVAWTASGTAGSASGTTGSDGKINITGFKAGCTFVITASKPPRFNDFTSGTITMGCSDTTGTNISMSFNTDGYNCWCACADPIAWPLSVTDSTGTHTFVAFGGVLTTPCIIKSGVTVKCTVSDVCTCGTSHSGDVAYIYEITCGDGNTTTLTRFMASCNCDPSHVCAPVAPGSDSICNETYNIICKITSTECTGTEFPCPGNCLASETVTEDDTPCPLGAISFTFTFGWTDTADVGFD